MLKALRYLKQNLIFVILIYVLVQLIYISFFPVKYQSDSYYYYKLAEDCIKSNSFYPAQNHLYEDYIVAPLYVNLLVIILNINNSTFTIGLFNIILNLLQLFLVYKVSNIIFGKDAAQISILIYIFYLNNLGLVLLNYTELIFGVLVFASVYFYLRKRKYSNIWAGVFAGASIGVRPLGWALLAAYAAIYIYYLFRKIYEHKEIFKLIIGASAFIILFGLFNSIHFGKFIYTSTTGSINLLMGANDNATGAFVLLADLKTDPGYIPDKENKTYIERDEIWRTRALNWIKAHPVKWISLIPLKFGYIFLWDDIAISPLMNLQDWDLFHVAKYLIINKNTKGLMPRSNLVEKISYLCLQTFHYIFYIILVFLIIKGLIHFKKNHGFNYHPDTIGIILFCVTGIFLTSLIYGVPRYKYPFLISLLPFAAFEIAEFIRDGRKKFQTL